MSFVFFNGRESMSRPHCYLSRPPSRLARPKEYLSRPQLFWRSTFSKPKLASRCYVSGRTVRQPAFQLPEKSDVGGSKGTSEFADAVIVNLQAVPIARPLVLHPFVRARHFSPYPAGTR